MRILVVEDNPRLADALQRGLGAEGFEVDATGDGLDGLWRAREFPYDVLVLDILLPGMNGFVLCRTLREEGVSTPILMLTAKDGHDDEAEGLDLGADDYLTKPFDFGVLVARVNALVRRSNPSPATSEIRTDGLTIDTTTRACTHDGRSLGLTPREHSVLEALARRLGQPLTRGELLDIVVGAEHDSGSNLIDVYIRNVRRKLAAVGGNPDTIETVRGVGYRLVRR
jgi:DNA-binding response OmpR family regulator